ncbi:unnamed protein product [Cuscuta campestris]|uniref:Uncharacterized protein n=1 Tax=Cuscuta campestris TaxID=132261 RepID=A0A484MKC7_9ASTE|nr:unnamed protein product [Cuscuta campestris]
MEKLMAQRKSTVVTPSPLIVDEKAPIPAKDDTPLIKSNPAYESCMLVDEQLRAYPLAIGSLSLQAHNQLLVSSSTKDIGPTYHAIFDMWFIAYIFHKRTRVCGRVFHDLNNQVHSLRG